MRTQAEEKMLKDVQDLLTVLVPDPKCRTCNGKKGYYGFTFRIALDGTRSVTPQICCGTYGSTDMSRIMVQFAHANKRLETILSMVSYSYQHTVWGQIHYRFTKIRDWIRSHFKKSEPEKVEEKSSDSTECNGKVERGVEG